MYFVYSIVMYGYLRMMLLYLSIASTDIKYCWIFCPCNQSAHLYIYITVKVLQLPVHVTLTAICLTSGHFFLTHFFLIFLSNNRLSSIKYFSKPSWDFDISMTTEITILIVEITKRNTRSFHSSLSLLLLIQISL